MRINTNVSALAAQTNLTKTNSALSSSLSKLSSGLRINTAADDASGMSIADSLRSQANALGQAVSNANDGVSIAQIADGAMDEQIKILDTIKTKATQAAQDGQSPASRKALQSDISKLVESLDNIAGSTSFNGKNLLSGSFTNAEFQIGAYSNQTVSMSIDATSSDKIGQTRFETSAMGTALGTATVTYTPESGAANNIVFESVTISTSAGTGIGALASVINKNSETTGVTASWSLTQTGDQAIAAGTVEDLTINGTIVAASLAVEANDSNGVLVDAINQFTSTTGVSASVDAQGQLNLTSTDGRAIQISSDGTNSLDTLTGIADGVSTGRLTLTKAGAADIQMTIAGVTDLDTTSQSESSLSLRDMMSAISADDAEAMGAFANDNVVGANQELTAGVTTYAGAQAMIKIAQTAQEKLDTIRANIGSVQNQLTSTINNISVTQVNVTSAESQIRDVDFAEESATFSKYNIMAQAGSYALSQANSTQQNVLKLLQ
ncbi:flagellin B [Sulfurospirillum barnesii]|uniref:Flagellin n=1 Tax=Sulfurospirillum barnesii (strain ATCC 700032 / DSM 10660 / SES-3) TaxID=760154 RepID=I3Y0L0_SULBS|nr:flagellin B [Sulfurospirillum barnesii]AFL69734.1 flagellin/flagellar hook associated protein [Sulfurospirillum barnesii SES-3]